jgi:hypothetical protein
MNYRHKRHFTIAEAIQSLYNHHSMIEKMQVLWQHLLTCEDDIRHHRPVPSQRILVNEFIQVMNVIRKLESAGILVKDVKQGIVDFPHIRENGDEVYLCFKLGDEIIQYWHTLDGGYASRQALDQL